MMKENKMLKKSKKKVGKKKVKIDNSDYKNMTYKQLVTAHNKSGNGMTRLRIKGIAKNIDKYHEEDFNNIKSKYGSYQDMVSAYNKSEDYLERKYIKEAARHRDEFDDDDFNRFNQQWTYDDLVKEHNETEDKTRRNYLRNMGKWRVSQKNGKKTRYANPEYNEKDWDGADKEQRYVDFVAEFNATADGRKRVAIKEKAKRLKDHYQERDFIKMIDDRHDYSYAELVTMYNDPTSDTGKRGWVKSRAKVNWESEFKAKDFPAKSKLRSVA